MVMALLLTGKNATLFALDMVILEITPNAYIIINDWALGVLIYFMLKGEMPFGSWRQSELDTFSKIAKGQLSLPRFSVLKQLISSSSYLKLMRRKDLETRTKTPLELIHGLMALIAETITSRVAQYLECYLEDCSVSLVKPSQDLEEQDTLGWFIDW
ncbi:unnamed protein product [Citrullus colocynthis]|uniref:Protein kinase domain-containing protein n=1 Tax=Citrullus colocynthis TaxID=252529 RepID=A0ABP0Z9G0_9ROSI